jgi:hypothetical protein
MDRDSTGAQRSPQGELGRFGGKIAGVVEAKLVNVIHEVASQ